MADLRKVMRNLEAFFKKEKALGHGCYLDHIKKRLEEATGLSRRHIYRFLNESKKPANEEHLAKRQTIRVLKEPKQKPAGDAVPKPVQEKVHDKRAPMQSIRSQSNSLDDFDRQVIRNKIHELYRTNEAVTLRTLQAKLLPEMKVSLSTLWRSIRLLGFRFIKKGSSKRGLAERTDVISQRHQYLRELRQARERGEHIVYLDETWVNVNHAYTGVWSENEPDSVSDIVGDGCGACGRTVPSGKGKRIIVLDAGCRNYGLLPSVADVFVAKSDCGDYHSEMNHEHFINWWKDTLLPALPGPSTIVIDQAPYHCVFTDDSRAPTTGWNVPAIRTWLRDHGIDDTDAHLKVQLLEIVRRNKPRPRYIVDQAAAVAGHNVLRLPPRHCELNPIELIWAHIKGFVARNNTTFKLVDTMKLFQQGKALITPDVWNKAEDHVITKVESRLWEADNVQDRAVDPVIISFDPTDDDDTYIDNIDDDICTDGTDDGALDLGVDETGDCGDMETDLTSSCLVCGSMDDPPDAIVKKNGRKGGRKSGSKEDEPFEWVKCDACGDWAHVYCIQKCDTVGIFLCPPCTLKIRKNYK